MWKRMESIEIIRELEKKCKTNFVSGFYIYEGNKLIHIYSKEKSLSGNMVFLLLGYLRIINFSNAVINSIDFEDILKIEVD